MQIVPRHSAILSAYPGRSIHANHMEMTKFSSSTDLGYQVVSNQLWLWTDEIGSEANTAPMRQLPPEELQAKSQQALSSASGEVNASGPVVYGAFSAGRNIGIFM
jgi:hypothetical protein